MKRYSITVNGNTYDVMVEEVDASYIPTPVVSAAPVAPAAPVAAPVAPAPKPLVKSTWPAKTVPIPKWVLTITPPVLLILRK